MLVVLRSQTHSCFAAAVLAWDIALVGMVAPRRGRDMDMAVELDREPAVDEMDTVDNSLVDRYLLESFECY